MIPSILRIEEHKALSTLTLDGRILDLGGDKSSYYQSVIKGDHSFYIVNISESARPDRIHDLEKPLPFARDEYDHVLLMNVLEHIFEYRSLIKESYRVVKDGGTITIVVPFLFPFHASPRDFHRFTGTALRKELELVGCKGIHVQALGSGVFSARLLFIDRLLPSPLRCVNYYITRHLAYFLDAILVRLTGIFSKKYRSEDYALGFMVTAVK